MEIHLCLKTGQAQITRSGTVRMLDVSTEKGRLALDVALQQIRDLALCGVHQPQEVRECVPA